MVHNNIYGIVYQDQSILETMAIGICSNVWMPDIKAARLVFLTFVFFLYQLDSERKSQTELKEAENSLQLELECVKQELDKKSLSLVTSQSELSTVTEV